MSSTAVAAELLKALRHCSRFCCRPSAARQACSNADLAIRHAQAVDKALKAADKQNRPYPAPPIDPAEAAKGRLDYATVKDWGSGEPAELGGLKVKSLSPKYAADGSMTFYEQLGRQIETAQVSERCLKDAFVFWVQLYIALPLTWFRNSKLRRPLFCRTQRTVSHLTTYARAKRGKRKVPGKAWVQYYQ